MKLDPRTWFRREEKASAAGYAVSATMTGQPVWTERSYEKLARESYVQNAIAFRCVAMTSQAVASVPLLLKDAKDKEIDTHPVIDLLGHPAPGYTQTWLLESLSTYLQLAGNAYLETVGPSRRNTPPRELWSLRPDRMRVIAGSQGLPQGYRYENAGSQKDWPVDPVTGYCDVLHLRRFHPTNDWYGLSLVEPAAFAVDRHNQAGAHNMAVLQNGATPSGMLVYKPVPRGDGKFDTAPAEVIDEAEKALLDRYSGSHNAGRPMVSNGNIDWVSFGMTMEQLQLTESKLDAARDICTAFGVPIELLLPGQSTYNNKREAKLGYYEETVLPLLEDTILPHLNNWLLPRFGEGMKLHPNYDEIEALALKREMRQEQASKRWNDGGITLDEYRAELQYEPRPDLPQSKVDAAVLTSLVNGAKENEAMYGPLFAYLKSIGLVPKGQTFEDWLLNAPDLSDDAEDVAAALLTDQTQDAKDEPKATAS